MLKPLTLSLSFALALGASSVSMAGLFDHGSGCSSCLASPQGVAPSAQAPIASAQCDTGCAPAKKHCGLGGLFSGLHKPKCYTYEWVLKKKRVWGHGGGCGGGGCDTCSAVYPSAQGPISSPQAYGSGQSYGGTYGGSSQAYGSGQYGSGQIYGATTATAPAPAPAPAGDEAPPAPNAPSAPSMPSAPEAPAPPAPNAPQSSLLFSTPSGN
jgi:hypothetical protein